MPENILKSSKKEQKKISEKILKNVQNSIHAPAKHDENPEQKKMRKNKSKTCKIPSTHQQNTMRINKKMAENEATKK